MEISISRLNLHGAQKHIIKNAKRFNTVRAGRRIGKSKLGVWLAQTTMLQGYPIGLFVPTHTYSEEFWEELKERMYKITSYKSESTHVLNTYGGGHIKIWSMEKERAGRGRKYKRVICDEFAFSKNPQKSWEQAIRPTLTDHRGDAWFLSTPNGHNNYFKNLCDHASEPERFPDWMSFHMPTHDNPFISKEELQDIEKQLDPLTYAQEYLAEFVTFAGKPFAYSFDRAKHVKEFGPPVTNYPLRISFDFNVDPMTCGIHQDVGGVSRMHDEFELKNSNTYELCDAILAKYGGFFYEVTGDATGKATDAALPKNINNYSIIKQKLNLQNNQMFVPTVNPDHSNSRVLCNSLLYRHPDYLIHHRCKKTILDLELVEMKDDNTIDKKKYPAHHLDHWRYYNNAFHYKFLKNNL